MDALGQQVGGENQRFAVAERQYGTVVADAFETVVGKGGEAGAYLFDKSEFGHVYFVLLWTKVSNFAENSYLCGGLTSAWTGGASAEAANRKTADL